MSWTKTRSEIAHAKRRDPNADTTELRRKMREERAAEYIKKLVDDAPPLTADQRARLAELLAPVRRTAGA